MWWEALLRDQCRRDSPKLKHRDHLVAVPAILDPIEADFVGHGDPSAMGVEGSLGVEVQILPPFESLALIGNVQGESVWTADKLCRGLAGRVEGIAQPSLDFIVQPFLFDEA